MIAESDFQAILVKGVRLCNGLVYPITGSRYQVKGMPDTYISHPYFVGWCEVKVKHRVSSEQRFQIKELKRTGANAFVIKYPGRIMDEHEKDVSVFYCPIGLIKNPGNETCKDISLAMLKALRELCSRTVEE